MIDNFNEIKRHLEFERDGDFYDLIILQRKKDQDVPSNYQSARTIKRYYIKSVEELERKKDEIVKLCQIFNARAGINLSRLNHEDLAFELNIELAKKLAYKQFNVAHLYESIVGNAKSRQKRFMIDLDTKDGDVFKKIYSFVKECSPYKNVIDTFETNKGFHFLCHPFDRIAFNEKTSGMEVELKETNYFALYYI